MLIVIVDYGMSNLGSITNMLGKIAAKATVTSDPRVVSQADKIILPGVGAFDAAMSNLAQRKLIDVLNQKTLVDRVPILGICLGTQLLARRSEEGLLPGLGWIDAEVRRFRFDSRSDPSLKIPHMGWNRVVPRQPDSILQSNEPRQRFYFVHSYHLVCNDPADTMGSTTYGYEFTSAVRRGNIMGVQFHPEKSHRYGLQLLKKFVEAA